MKPTLLRPKSSITLPVEAESINPDCFLGLSQEEVAGLPIYHGRRRLTIGDLFIVEGNGSAEILVECDTQLHPAGLSHVKRIGQAMTQGRIEIRADSARVGMHLGAEMRGGEIIVHGDVDAWAGAQMRGGTIKIYGNAGPMLGAAYVGEKRGMQGGLILVTGHAGARMAERMRRGTIAVGGDTGEFVGARMIAGSVFIFGKLGPRPGAGMKRGTIAAFGGLAGGLLPTFNYSCTYQPLFLRFYLDYLANVGMPVQPEQAGAQVRRYTGDIVTLGKGEILVYGE